MAYWDYERTAGGASLILAAAAARGVTAKRGLRGTGLQPEDLDDPSVRLQAGEELQIARNVVEELGDPPGLGVDAGRRMTIATFGGPWGLALLTSETWADALALSLRLRRLTPFFVDFDLVARHPMVRLEIIDSGIPADIRRFFAERDLASLLAVTRALMMHEPLPEMVVETSLPSDSREALAAILPPQIRLVSRASGHAWLIASGTLDLPLPQGNAALRRVYERESEQLLEVHRSSRPLTRRIRARMLHEPSDIPSMTHLAAEWHVDVRTLRRQLAAEGTSYRDLREEVIATLAAEMLHAGLYVREIAAQLGYADASGFTRAFTRVNGTAPSAFRQPAG